MANSKDVSPLGFGETDDFDNRSFKSLSRHGSSSSNSTSISTSSSSSGSVSEDSLPPPPINYSTRPAVSPSTEKHFPEVTVTDVIKPSETTGRKPRKVSTSSSSSDSSSSNDSDEDPPPAPAPIPRKDSDSSKNDVEEYYPTPVKPPPTNQIKPKPTPTVDIPPPPSSTSSSDSETPYQSNPSILVPKIAPQPNRNDFSSKSSVDEYILPKKEHPLPVVQPIKKEDFQQRPAPAVVHIDREVFPIKETPFVPNEKRTAERDQLHQNPPPGMTKVTPSFPSADHSERPQPQPLGRFKGNSSGDMSTMISSTRTDPAIGRTIDSNTPRKKASSSSSNSDQSDIVGGSGPETLVKSVDVRRPKEGEVIYSWLNLNVRVGPEDKGTDVEKGGCFGLKKKPVSKVILQNVTGVVYPGQLVAIMGASGAGKTTLLNVLTFRNTRNLKIKGDIFANGVPVHDSDMLSSISAYVQQDDLFIGSLTVREHLIFQARLRMDKGISFQERVKRVDEVISDLGLTKCKDTLIGIPGRIKGISGGEMKRLSFASEVLTNPSLMFCDEPTSGLDSFMASSVISVLKKMAARGKTIVCTIHQPSSEVYDLFDRLLLMAEGRPAYLGDAKQVIPFFKELGYECPQHFNPADFFIQTLAIRPNEEAESSRKKVHAICNSYENILGQKVQESVERINRSNLGLGQITKGKGSVYKASWFAQFFAVFWRCWKTQFKDPMIVMIRGATTIFVALLVGLIYLQQDYNQEGLMNINGAIFLMLTNITFQNVFGVVNGFASELPVFLREHFNGMYRTDVYFLCKTLAELPVFIALPVIFTTINYWMIGFNSDVDRYLIACGIITLITNIACSFGYMISCISSSVNMALAIGPVMIIPFLLFGGFFLNSGSVPVWLIWLKYMSWFHYGNEALSINQWKGVEIECNRSDNLTSSCVTDGNMLLENLGYNEDNLILDCCMLVVLLLSFRIIAFFGLLVKTYRAK